MSYTVREAAAMSGVSPSQIRAFVKDGLLHPDKGSRGELLLGFADLVTLRAAGELNKANVSPRRVRKALEALREQLQDGKPLTSLRIAAYGEQVIVRDGEIVWAPESGQALFDFAVSGVAQKAEVVRHEPGAPTDDEGLTADAWYDIACDLELDDLAAAKEAYARALRLDSTHADAHVNLGRLLHEGGAPAAAEPHYRAAVAVDPDHPLAPYNLGVALEDLGRLDEAIEAYRYAIDHDPGNADAHYNLAGVYERRGDARSAIQHLKEYSKLSRGAR